MDSICEVPEIAGLGSRASRIRIPQEIDVPLTPRVRALIDTAEFHRLGNISQLGLVATVYPAANHTRFEHSLGVYRQALLWLSHMSHDDRFSERIGSEQAELFIVAALLHDLGHWPFCHPIEDVEISSVPRHELFVNSFLLEGEIADVLHQDWKINPRDIIAILSGDPQDSASRLLANMLSGPIDIDKMDYLARDSLHAGVPYGRNFDQNRLIGSLCLNEAGDGLAIREKGKTAAEMMVFARYVMFSEVYWHHAVRTATSMFQRAFFMMHESLDFDSLFRMTEPEVIRELLLAAQGTCAADLLKGLFGPKRKLYKRIAQYSFFEQHELYVRLARRPYAELVACSAALAKRVSETLGREIAPHELLIDAPPVGCEVEFHVDVYYAREDRYRPLAEVSPVVRTLAKEQFDDYVKRVRVFVHPRVADELRAIEDFPGLVHEAIDATLC